jgi:hypothetical protein
MFLFVGPNEAPGAGSTIHMSECACEYMINTSSRYRGVKFEVDGTKLSISQIASRYVEFLILNHAKRDLEVDRYFAKSTFTFTV